MTTHWSLYGSMFLAGLAGSLHCIGMCGPILLAFSKTFSLARPQQGGFSQAESGHTTRRGRAIDFACYHVGRIWTYTLMGGAAGLLGRGLLSGSFFVDWQRPIAVTLSALVVASGLLLLDLLPGAPLQTFLNGCGLDKLRGTTPFGTLLSTRGPVSRLMLGAVMGFLPCGLVYAMLAMVASLAHPVWSALGMLAFGLGTLPALSTVLIASGFLPMGLRRHGPRLAGAFVLLSGCWMLVRSLSVEPLGHCLYCAVP